jgi:hypothetical protein
VFHYTVLERLVRANSPDYSAHSSVTNKVKCCIMAPETLFTTLHFICNG